MTLKGVDRAAAVCGIPRSRPLQGTIASHPPECGVASVSDRLDIVRLIDSKVTATRRTVARSKQLAEAAKDDLTTHAEWLERHRRQAQEESERHERRLGRRRRVEGCKRFALWLLLLVPSACAAMFRAACSGLAALGEAFYFGCCWIGTTAHALGRGRHSPHDRQRHLGRDGASHARAVGGRRVLACRLRARRRGRTRRGLGVRRRLARHVLAWPKVAQPQPLARSGLVVRLLPARRPDREPRHMAHRHDRRADQGPRYATAGRRHASR